ncbi:MAG TPA: tripartite tricarboxylate transporter substrate-binding protein [Alphaproteobacteria bacterium]
MTNTSPMVAKLGAAALFILLAASSAAAQDYPQRPVKLIVPFPAGGVADTVGRVVAQKLTSTWGQQAVIDNRTGAAGLVGVEVAAHAPADGYTLLLTTSDFVTVNPAAYPKLNYDPDKDFVPIAMLAKSPSVIVVNANAGIANLKDLAAAANAKPGEIAYSSPGAGTTNHLAAELLASDLKIKLLPVQYRGGAPAATAVATGEATLGVVAIPTGKAHVEAGTVKVLGITTADRASFVPDWPTIAEGGLPGFDLALWIVLYGPAGTPQPILKQLQSEVAVILKDADVRTRFAGLGAEPAEMPYDAFVARMKSDRATLGDVIKRAGVRIE